MKIKNIQIESFRGIPYLDQPLNEKSLLIHGENGTGKSSIVDAIEYFFTGKISHLSRPFSIKSHGTHTNYSPEDLKVCLELNPTSCSLERTLDSLNTCPDELKDDMAVAENIPFILRRSQILEFINSAPGDRYKQIGSMIGVDNLEKIESTLKNALDDIHDNINTKLRHSEKINENLGQILDDDLKEADEILSSINNFLDNEDLDPLESVDEIEDYVNKLEKTVKTIDSNKIHTLDNISRKIKKIDSADKEITELFEKIEDLKEKIFQEHDISDLSLIEILKTSKKILTEKSETCPICENEIDGKELVEKIDERLTGLEILKQNHDELKKSINDLYKLIELDKRNLESLIEELEIFEELNDFNDIANTKKDSVENLLKNINQESLIKEKIQLKDYETLKSSLEEFLKDLTDQKEKLEEELKPSEKDEKITEICESLSKIKDYLSDLNDLNELISQLESKLKIVDKMHAAFSKIRKEKIQEVYGTIEKDVQDFYSIIHPNELYDKIKIDIDHSRRASTNLKMTIFGKEDQDPRALSSEGHLDSLGLCIFLALFKNFNKEFPLLVLDDVVSTMDSRHREHVCKLLFEKFGDKQFIITTHDGIWFDQLKAAQRAYGLAGKFQNIQIIGWDLENGPVIDKYTPRWNRIQKKIKERDTHCAGNEGRRYLEWLLKEICTNSKTKIPLKPSGRYEINDLFDPAQTRMIELIKDPNLKKELESSFDELKTTMIMGNLLSHENLMAGNVSIDEVESFCNSIHKIHEFMLCDECNNPLRYYQELKVFRCSGKNCSKPTEIKC
jgi:DNA repair exonuclease SbcCD ATPase subunit